VPPPRPNAGTFISDLDLPDIDLSTIADGPRLEDEPTLQLIMDRPPPSKAWFYWLLAGIAVTGAAAVYAGWRFGWIQF
jgi:hypothetical protein